MTTTIKEYQYNTKFRKFIKNEMEDARMSSDWDRHNECQIALAGLEDSYFEGSIKND